MVARGQICNKWHRYCIGCGRRAYINAVRNGPCDECDGDRWTRNKEKAGT